MSKLFGRFSTSAGIFSPLFSPDIAPKPSGKGWKTGSSQIKKISSKTNTI